MSARATVRSIQDLVRQDVGVDGNAQRLSQRCWTFFLKTVDDRGGPEELLAKPEQDEPTAAALSDRSKVILAEALLR